MKFKNFPLGYGDLDVNLKYIFIIVNIFLDNYLLDKEYLKIDKKDHGKRLMNFEEENGIITFTKGKDGEKYFLDIENKKILNFESKREFIGPIFDEFPAYLLGSIGFFNINEDLKSFTLNNNVKYLKDLLDKIGLNTFNSYNKKTFENEQIILLLKSIFLKSPINNRIINYLELKNISKSKLEKIINSSNETKYRKEILTTFIFNSFDKDIDLLSGISKKDFENSFAVLNGQTGRNANNRTAWIYEYLSFLGLITFNYRGDIIFYNNGFSNILQDLSNPKFDLNKNHNNLIKEPEPIYNINTLSSKSQKMINNLTSQESLLLLSLLTKPFSILYGVSGTGKSRVVQELWKKMYPGKDENSNEIYKNYFNKEAVPPNWFDETEVLGRYNAIEGFIKGSFTKTLERAVNDSENNYVYLLDEMNLSHIEQYFAQYLSAIEELNKGDAWIHIGKKTNNIKNINILDNKYKYPESCILKKDKNGNIIDSYLSIAAAGLENKIAKSSISSAISGKRKSAGGYVWDKKNNIRIIQKDSYGKNITIFNNILDAEKKSGVNKEKIIGYINGKYQNEGGYKWTLDNNNNNNNNIINYYNDDNKPVGISLKLPKNLFVVGTINLDETTKSISPKVVDRANLIEFNDIGDFLGIENKESRYKLDFLDKLNIDINFNKFLEIRDRISNLQGGDDTFNSIGLSTTTEHSIKKLYSFLKVFKLHFSYRTIKEIIIFILIGKELLKNNTEKNIKNNTEKNIENKLFDIAIMQKVLPKLNGVIDYNLKLYLEGKDHKNNKYLWYDTEDSLLSDEIKKDINKGFAKYDDNFTNSAIKLERMQQFFDTYQNVNYFLS